MVGRAVKSGALIVRVAPTIDYLQLVARYADVLQIGARNMQNYQLLEEGASVTQEAPPG